MVSRINEGGNAWRGATVGGRARARFTVKLHGFLILSIHMPFAAVSRRAIMAPKCSSCVSMLRGRGRSRGRGRGEGYN